MLELKITAIGSSAGVILPKKVLARLKVGKGDQIFVVETKDGYLMTPYDRSLDEPLERAAHEVTDAFRALAK